MTGGASSAWLLCLTPDNGWPYSVKLGEIQDGWQTELSSLQSGQSFPTLGQINLLILRLLLLHGVWPTVGLSSK